MHQDKSISMQIIKLNKKISLIKLPGKHDWWARKLTENPDHQKKEAIIKRPIKIKTN